MMTWTAPEPKPWWKDRFKRWRNFQVALHCVMAALALGSIFVDGGLTPTSIAIQLTCLWSQMAIHVIATDDLRDRVRELHHLSMDGLEAQATLLKAIGSHDDN